MRRFLVSCTCLVACAQPKPVQDPLHYLRIGVDPRSEADAIIDDLRAHRFQIERRIEDRDFVAFDAARGGDSTVRVVTSRGPALSVSVPDARWPERISVQLASGPRPDFDRDGRQDVVIAIGEGERTCLAWLQVDSDGFVSEVFHPSADWGERPCVIEIDVSWPRLLLEVSVPDYPWADARVELPIKATARSWVLDDSAAASARWESEIELRKQAIETSRQRGDLGTVRRLEAELAWLEQLRNGQPPVLEAEGDGEEAR
ncbi:MAG: hypothetical protein WCE62_11180 [Polyangiales bacterium]